MSITAILGAQWGDEGKGKIACYFSRGAEICARFQGGPNAGHTIWVNGNALTFRMLPAGVITATRAVIGNGTVINPGMLVDEVAEIRREVPDIVERLSISWNAHVIFPSHIERDSGMLSSQIGTSRKGVGPAYSDKASRTGIRIRDLLAPGYRVGSVDEEYSPSISRFADMLGDCCVDTTDVIRAALDRGKLVIAEGGQGALLDIDHGDYPYVTSSNTTIGGVLTGLGVGARDMSAVYLVAAAYMTKVGGGPFPTRVDGSIAEHFRTRGESIDEVSHQPREYGWLDLIGLRRAVKINGADGIILTKLDVMAGLSKVCLSSGLDDSGGRHTLALKGWDRELSSIRQYEALPVEVREFMASIESEVKVPIIGVSVGPEIDQYIERVVRIV